MSAGAFDPFSVTGPLHPAACVNPQQSIRRDAQCKEDQRKFPIATKPIGGAKLRGCRVKFPPEQFVFTTLDSEIRV
jgi:hypothetical protein